ncbi:MAG: DUF58 domain-containing protein [Planctomycetota bacterium]
MTTPRQLLSRDVLRAVQRIRIRTRRVVADVMAGAYRSVFRGAGIEFDEVREYSHTDDARAIDWNVTARLGRPHVRTYVEERELTVVLLVDVSGSLAFTSAERTKSEIAAEVCAILGFAGLENGDKVGLLLFTDQVEVFVPPRKGVAHGLRLLRELLNLQTSRRQTDIGSAIAYADRWLRRRSILFVVSDFLSGGGGHGGWIEPLERAARRHEIVAVRLTDARERSFPPAGLLCWRDLETDALVEVDLSSRRVREGLARRAREHDEALRRELARLRVDLIDVDPLGPVDRPLVAFFQARARRGR